MCVGGKRKNGSAERIWEMRMGKIESLDGNEDEDGEILTIKLQDLYVCECGIRAREGGYCKGISFSPAFHISHFCKLRISLQGTYSNVYHHSNLPPAGFSVPVDFS